MHGFAAFLAGFYETGNTEKQLPMSGWRLAGPRVVRFIVEHLRFGFHQAPHFRPLVGSGGGEPFPETSPPQPGQVGEAEGQPNPPACPIR